MRRSRRRPPSPFTRDTTITTIPENMQDENNTLSTVRRSSVSRRLDPLLSSDSVRQRARSEERNVPEPDSDDEAMADKQHQQQHSPKGFLTRIDSDPLDSPGAVAKQPKSKKLSQDASISISPKKKSPPLPTLPRYPISETKNHNCWSEPHAGKCFKVRGENYLVDKKKVASGPYIFPARGADLILTNEESGLGTNIAERHCVLAGHVRSVPTL